MLKCAILDDYQDVSRRIADWSAIEGAAEIRVFTDPIADRLPEHAPWRGCGGEYTVAIGRESSSAPGHDASLPTMHASVNAFTRLWIGVDSATSIAFSDDLDGPPELLAQLDRSLRLPSPYPDWQF